MRNEPSVTKAFYMENIFVSHKITDDFHMSEPHFHDGYEIHLTLMDGTVFYIDSHTYALKAGGLTVVSNNEMHRVQPAQGMYERYIISFVPEFIADLERLDDTLLSLFISRPGDFSHCVQLSPHQIAQFIDHFKRLDRYCETGVGAAELKQKLELGQALLFCNEVFSKSNDELSSNIATGKINTILSYIKKNPSADLTLDRICRDFYISKSHLIRSFREATGMTPNDYIVLTRIMKSRQYLKEGLSVMKTCELIGYADESHFIRTFKRHVGITPKQYGLIHSKKQNPL